MHKATFTVDDNKLAYIGYTQGETWKHYAVPYFDIDTAIQIVNEYNTIAEYPIIYDSIYDNFYLYDEANQEYEIYKGQEFTTAEGIKKLYPIKSWYWWWEEFTDGDIDILAEGIEDYLWEFEHMDQYTNRADLLKEIKTQLKELETLAEAIKIYYSDTLNAEEIYNSLNKILFI